MTDKPKKIRELVGIFEILPEDVDTNLEEIIENAKKTLVQFKATVSTWRAEEVAYGLKKIFAQIIFPDNIEGGTQPIEDALTQLPNVQRIECSMVSNAKS